MKQKIFTVLAAALLLMGATGCTKGEDNPSSTDMRLQEQDLIGLWYDEYEYADVTETGVPFSRVLLAVDVEADHSGCIYLGVFDESSDEPLAVYGGPDEAGFIWQILPDGSVVLTDPATSESRVVTRADNGGNFGKAMTNVANTSVTVADGSVTVTNGNYSGELAKADAQKKAEIEQKMAAAISYEWLTNATANDIGKVVCEAGHLHKAKQKVPNGCTAVGILGSLDDFGNGLILALWAAKKQSGNVVDTWPTETSFAGTKLRILPDNDARGRHLKSYTSLGGNAVSNWAVGQKSDYVTIFRNLSGDRMSRDVPFEPRVESYVVKAGGERAYDLGLFLSDTQRAPKEYPDIMWCYFHSGWYGSEKHRVYSIWPIMGFKLGAEKGPQGAVAGAFSVGNGKKVFFSKGNLQYVGSWQFAEHQWDIFGADQRDDHRDLFGWGTADNPNNVSTNAADYSWSEWGANAIANAATGYRTLTFDECDELISNLRKSNHSGLATVNGVRGVVMLCDRWLLPSGCTFTPIPMDNYSYTDWDSNTYSAEQWATMEAAGAVFLPCAGQRNGTVTELANVYPFYWASSKRSDSEAYAWSYTLQLNIGYAVKNGGLSVRLVKDAE